LLHISDHRGYIIRESCAVLGQNYKKWFYRVRWYVCSRCYGSM